MSHRLTNNQLLHRQYLQSPVWKVKRQEALIHYGCICNRCEKEGRDVHHRTYERVGGAELMEDLEVLCRPCHEAHHRVEKATRQIKPAKIKSIDQRAIFLYLTKAQKDKLVRDFSLSNTNELSLRIGHSTDESLILAAVNLLGFTHYHGGPNRKKNLSKPSCWERRTKQPPKDRGRYISFNEFKQIPSNNFPNASSSNI